MCRSSIGFIFSLMENHRFEVLWKNNTYLSGADYAETILRLLAGRFVSTCPMATQLQVK